jgi:putative transposase
LQRAEEHDVARLQRAEEHDVARCQLAQTVMPSTYVSLHCHLVFSTKDREPWITPDWRDRLRRYLGGIVNGLGGIPLAIGGTENHVHLLVGFRSSHRLDYFLRDLKADSTAWVHREICPQFSWQRGYAAFAAAERGAALRS